MKFRSTISYASELHSPLVSKERPQMLINKIDKKAPCQLLRKEKVGPKGPTDEEESTKQKDIIRMQIGWY